jgi:primosomal protein N' (replication factor Y)
MLVEIAVPANVRKTFTYRLPARLADQAKPGSRVIVPFRNKLLTGFIVELHHSLKVVDSEIKDVEKIIDDTPVISDEILLLAKWMSDYYYAPLAECLRAAIPAGSLVVAEKVYAITDAGLAVVHQGKTSSRKPSLKLQALKLLADEGSMSLVSLKRQLSPGVIAVLRELQRSGLVDSYQRTPDIRLRPKLQNVVRQTLETRSVDQILDRDSSSRKLTQQQLAVINLLAPGREIPLAGIIEHARVSASVVRTLEKKGLVEIVAREVRRNPLAHIENSESKAITLNPDQQQALDQILTSLDDGRYATFLLHGVTGSGKTEIYIRAMHETLNRGRSALMLVPEIALTPVFSRRLRGNFGEMVAILHSSLSDGERMDEWQRIRRGEARVVIGTRSAVMAPLQNLGLIVVDEEHDSSYTQDETPRYNGRDAAVVRGLNANAVVVLGSATPSVESFHNARSDKYTYIRLEYRYGNRPLAEVQLVDMREVFKRHGKQQSFSDELRAALAETLDKGEQAIVLLNRRGFSSFLLCRTCGLAIRCPNCDVTLTYHRQNFSLLCHYCNFVSRVPEVCPACNGEYIHYVGEGTEQLEEKLRKMFPNKGIARVDRDSTRRRGTLEHLLMEFASGSLDLLVGTQMIAKGHDFPNVTLVGVISVDIGLSLPDFRAAERTFQLLTQVAGRAGRGDLPGRVLIQTYHPEHYALAAASRQDYEGFYHHEFEFRRTMHYPPFSVLINVLIRDKKLERASQISADLGRALRDSATDTNVRVLGPAPAPFAKLKGEYRFQILIKARSRKSARQTLDRAMNICAESGLNQRAISIEVDPTNLM